MTLPSHFYISECDGALFDTRMSDWALRPLRPNYAKIDRHMSTGTQALRAAIRNPHTFPGGYELAFITSDGGVLCHECVKENYRQISWSMRHEVNDGWRVVAVDNSSNIGESCPCDHYNRELSPYVDDEEDAA